MIEKRFILHCRKCKFQEMSTGLTKDLTHLVPRKTCASCNGPRTYKCPTCSGVIKLLRVKGNKE